MIALAEIAIPPPYFPKWIKFSIRTWINLCVFKALYTFSIVKYIKEAKAIMKEVGQKEGDALIVSHQARIITLLIYCTLSSKWKVLQTNLKPAGLCIVERR
jgi:hypothetical protein